ncbi:M14 family metallopeptidase [bacterium]|nr:M14 family metallopeptidase [bacterium]
MNKYYFSFCLLLFSTFVSADTSNEWLIRAERTSFQETSRYDETVDYCKKLMAASPWIHYTTFGKSPEGRDLPLVIASREQLFTSEAARKGNHFVVLIINSIHAGEIAGKDASLMLLREMAITKKLESLLQNVIVMVVPIFNVDGHERFGPYNRINQSGPKEMGWRTSSQNLNLNRDFMKADQPEMQAMLKLYTQWLPEFMLDNHISDGADFQYDILYIVQKEPVLVSPLFQYWQEKLEPKLVSDLTKSGHITGPYFEMINDKDPKAGIEMSFASPRFSDGYTTYQNRLGMTAETHSLKPYETQVRANYDLMISLLRELNNSGTNLKQSELKMDDETIALGNSYDPNRKFPIRFDLNKEKKESMLWHGVEYQIESSPISGAKKIVYGKKPQDITIPVFKTVEVVESVATPLAYLIPPQWTEVIDRLQFHNIAIARTSAPFSGKFETYRFHNTKWPEEPFEGRFSPTYEATKVVEQRDFLEGSVLVRLNQRNNRVILGLLEPQSTDSFVAWGFFNAIFEQKEDAEAYILEDLAGKMLKENPELRTEFEQKIKSDSKFASDPLARLRFFYVRSPFWDTRKDAYPIVRITDDTQLKAIPVRSR